VRFAHLRDAERPLAVVDGDRVTPLSLDGIATIDELVAAGPDAWESARDAAAADDGEPLRPGMLGGPLRPPSELAGVGLN
jgi:hypothetical protein